MGWFQESKYDRGVGDGTNMVRVWRIVLLLAILVVGGGCMFQHPIGTDLRRNVNRHVDGKSSCTGTHQGHGQSNFLIVVVVLVGGMVVMIQGRLLGETLFRLVVMPTKRRCSMPNGGRVVEQGVAGLRGFYHVSHGTRLDHGTLGRRRRRLSRSGRGSSVVVRFLAPESTGLSHMRL